MLLASRIQIGTYEIPNHIGEGRGDVYRSRNLKLVRDDYSLTVNHWEGPLDCCLSSKICK